MFFAIFQCFAGKVYEIPREEDFPEFPLLRDRLFLAEQRATREELEIRCPTPEITYADDDPDRPPDNPLSNPSTFIDPRPWTVTPTVLPHSLDRETASSSLYNASNYYSTPFTRPSLSCVTPAPSSEVDRFTNREQLRSGFQQVRSTVYRGFNTKPFRICWKPTNF